MLTIDQKLFIKNRIKKKLERLQEDITFLKETTKPIAPENAIGRVSRMDAINNKSVAEQSLRQAIDKQTKLKEALQNIDNKDYGICFSCKKEISFVRLKFMPEARNCKSCAR